MLYFTPEQKEKKVAGFIYYVENSYRYGRQAPFNRLRNAVNSFKGANDCYMKDDYYLEFYTSNEYDYKDFESLSEKSKEFFKEIILKLSQTKPLTKIQQNSKSRFFAEQNLSKK